LLLGEEAGRVILGQLGIIARKAVAKGKGVVANARPTNTGCPWCTPS
jgi:hypothetical protein